MDNPPVWRCGAYSLSFEFPTIMAIINVTPDSFSGDGLASSCDAAVRRAEEALRDGARILDIGGESSRPGSESVSIDEELDRVIPVVEALVPLGVPISVDTVKPQVMRAAILAGAAIINDINALQAPGAQDVVAASDVGVCVMHMQGAPRSMQTAPEYQDVVAEVNAFLHERCTALCAQGVERARLAVDPGFGFGKTLEHNIGLFQALPGLVAQGLPVLVGVSRKAMLGALTGRAVGERMPASISAAILAAQRGAAILRVHDVAATRDALTVWAAIERDKYRAY